MILDFPSTKLSTELAEKYGYDEFLIRRWVGLFGREAKDLAEGMERVPKYLRVNTIKIGERELTKRMERRGFRLKNTEIPYCYELISEPFSAGSTPEYLMGYYYLMDKSSCVPPLALAEEFEFFNNPLIVDFASSPGGKVTMISQLMKERNVRGKILALEAQKDRLPALIDNVHRMGVKNVAVLHMDARNFPEYGVKADLLLLDAPCTGEGIIHKDESRKKSRGRKDIEFCSRLQKELLSSAIKSVKAGGIIVYSTCSIAPEENELVVQWALDNFPVEVEKIEIPGERGLTEFGGIKVDERLKLAKRYYPHRNRCSGFFVAKLRVVKSY